MNDWKKYKKRRVSNRCRISNKRRGLEVTLEHQPYTSYVIATENLVLTQIIPCFLAKQVDVNAEN